MVLLVLVLREGGDDVRVVAVVVVAVGGVGVAVVPVRLGFQAAVLVGKKKHQGEEEGGPEKKKEN